MDRENIRSLIKGKLNNGTALREALQETPFDERLEIDLTTGGFHILEHVEAKYYGVVTEGDFSRIINYAADHFLHPDDCEAYRSMFDTQTMAERLKEAEIPGFLEREFRMRATNEAWIHTYQILIAGELLDQPDHFAYSYVYDLGKTVQEDDFSVFGDGSGDNERYEEVTGLLQGVDFFKPAQRRIEELRNGWCLINIDIRHFKLFIDWYGVESGRYMLSSLARLLRRVERTEMGMSGYMGQDQFCLIIPYDEEKIRALQKEMLELIESISPIEGFEPYFGVAMIDESSNQIQEFYNRAALTTDEIKENVASKIRVYDPAIHKQNAREYELLADFRCAIEQGEITFFLQPQFRVSNRKVVGAESLARWKRPDGSWISPAYFVPILEKHGLIQKLDMFIWESVCKWCRSWLDREHQLVPISVNVSRQDITAIDVPEFLTGLLEKYDLKPDDIHVEITETAYADDFSPVAEAAAELRRRGFYVLMDDFGSGYSSLSMLRTMNMDVIKLDAQFLQLDRSTEIEGVGILESIVNMTRSLSKPIIVEGVEDEYQAQFLSELGCAYMQGFFFARPMPVEEFEKLIGDQPKVDEEGLVFKANQQLRVREIFDESIYSDGMLNNILGPVAFYNLKGDDISIVRYNEQFFELVGLNEIEMDRRIDHIQNYMPEEDYRELLGILAKAEEHPSVGGRGVVRASKPNGVFVWLDLNVFFLEENRDGKRFYVSAHDVSETSLRNADLPGAYYRTTIDDNFEFLFISQNFLDMTGYTEDEIRIEFDNKMNNMTHPADRVDVHEWSHEILRGEKTAPRPYRIRRKRGDYMYIAEQDQITDWYGAPCYQSIAIDVTDVMAMRNQMRILSDHLTDTILFVRPLGNGLEFEAVIYNLEEQLNGMTAEEFESSLNEGSFFEQIDGYDALFAEQDLPREEFIKWYMARIEGGRKDLTIHLPGGRSAEMPIRADRVDDNNTRVEYIVMMQIH